MCIRVLFSAYYGPISFWSRVFFLFFYFPLNVSASRMERRALSEHSFVFISFAARSLTFKYWFADELTRCLKLTRVGSISGTANLQHPLSCTASFISFSHTLFPSCLACYSIGWLEHDSARLLMIANAAAITTTTCLPAGHLFHPPLRSRRLLPSSYLLLSFDRVTTRSIPRPCFLETSFSSWPSFLKTIFFSLSFFPLYYIFFSVVLFNGDSRANRAYVASELGRNSAMNSNSSFSVTQLRWFTCFLFKLENTTQKSALNHHLASCFSLL